jgi:hypothetical protein
MLRRRFLIGLGTLLALLAVVAGVLYWLVRHVPEVYEQAAVPAGPERVSLAGQFISQAALLQNWRKNKDDPRYADEHEFLVTDKQVNSYVAEDGALLGLPGEVKEPRIIFRKGGFTLAFRYGEGFFSAVVSVEVQCWISKQEPNAIVMQIDRLRIGAIPLSPKLLQTFVADSVRDKNTDVQWFRNQGKPVAVFRLQSNKREPEYVIDALDLADGSLAIKCRRNDSDARKTTPGK